MVRVNVAGGMRERDCAPKIAPERERASEGGSNVTPRTLVGVSAVELPEALVAAEAHHVEKANVERIETAASRFVRVGWVITEIDGDLGDTAELPMAGETDVGAWLRNRRGSMDAADPLQRVNSKGYSKARLSQFRARLSQFRASPPAPVVLDVFDTASRQKPTISGPRSLLPFHFVRLHVVFKMEGIFAHFFGGRLSLPST